MACRSLLALASGKEGTVMTTPSSFSTSASLLDRLREPNNEAAWRTFLQRYQPLIYRWCCRWGLRHEDAEDVSATVWTKLVAEMPRFIYDPQKRFRSWLKTVVHNAKCNFLDRRGRHPDQQGVGGSLHEERLQQQEAPW